jgi:hypothetical protein
MAIGDGGRGEAGSHPAVLPRFVLRRWTGETLPGPWQASGNGDGSRTETMVSTGHQDDAGRAIGIEVRRPVEHTADEVIASRARAMSNGARKYVQTIPGADPGRYASLVDQLLTEIDGGERTWEPIESSLPARSFTGRLSMRPLPVDIEDGEDFDGTVECTDGMRRHGGELRRIPRLDRYLPLAKMQEDAAREHGEPRTPGVHAHAPRAGETLGGDPHLGHQAPPRLERLAGEQPRRQAGFLVWLGPDDHVLIFDRLDEMVDRRTQGTGQGNELVQADAALARLDPTQHRRAEVAPGGKRVETPAARLPQPADALSDHSRQVDFRHLRDRTTALAQTATNIADTGSE